MFWFLVSVILFIMLVSRNKNNEKTYAQGYTDGYREFCDKLQKLIVSRRTDATSLQKLIDGGEDMVAEKTPTLDPSVKTAESRTNLDDNFVMDVLGEEEPEANEWPVHQQVAYPQNLQSTPVELSPEEKAKRSLRNLNLILYTASFLLVAAGALFVASTSTAMVKLIGVCVIIAVFYFAGYIIYTKVERLRPAGLAFLGTGLALIPFAGFAFQDFSNLSATTSWLITSLAGLVAYFAAAILLQSQLVSYLTMAFVLSLVGSTTAIGTKAIVWQFVAIIGVSLIASIVAYFKPQWLPRVFSTPIERTGQIVTPVALVASLTIFDRLLITDYEIVFAVATLHYIVAWMQTRAIAYETIIRILSYIVLALIAWDIFESSLAAFGFSMVLMMSFQHAYSLLSMNRPGHGSIERVWIGVLFALQLLLMLCWQNHPQEPLFTTISLLVIGLTSCIAALRLRSVGTAVIGLGVSLIVPFTVVRRLFDVPLPWWTLVIWFGAMAVAALWGYAKIRDRSKKLRVFMTTAYVLYVFLALMVTMIDSGQWLAVVVYAATAIFALIASYVARAPYAQLFVPFFVLVSVASAVQNLNIKEVWQPLCIGAGTAIALWLLACVHGSLRQSIRQILMTAAGQVTFLIIIGAIAYHDAPVDAVVLTLLLVAAFGSLGLRWRYKILNPPLSTVFACSYPVYFAVALLAAAVVGSAAVATVAGVGVVLFLVASYVERSKWIQVVAVVLTVVMLSVVAKLIPLAPEWRNLFTHGVSAALFYAGAGLHYAYKQADRQLLMVVSAYITLFFIAFTGMTGTYLPTLTAFSILLVWAALTLALRWWNRDRSSTYSVLFQAAYPVYYIAALLLASTLTVTWFAVALAVGTVLAAAASYAERAPKLEIVGGVLTVLTLMSLANVFNVPAQWFMLFVFGVAAGVFCLAAGYHRGSGEADRQLIVTIMAQMTLIWIIFTPAAGHYMATLTAFIVLLAWALVSLALRWWSRDRSRMYSAVFRASYLVYYLAALLMAAILSPIWSVIALTVGAAVFWIASYSERLPLVILVGNAFFVAALVNFWWWAGFSSEWMILGISWILAGLFYFGYWMFKGLYDELRSQALLWSTWLVLLYASVAQYGVGTMQIAAMATLIAFALTLAVEGMRRKSRLLVELSAYVATFAAQRIAAILWPELNTVFYAHWWAITLVLVALFGSVTHRQLRLVIAAALVTTTTGLYALTSGKEYQLLFLIEHLALLVGGAILSKSWAIWWGIVATAVAILYFLRNYTFLLLGFLGLLLIAIVVWRLIRSGNGASLEK